MKASITPDRELIEKLLKLANLQADIALKEAQVRHQRLFHGSTGLEPPRHEQPPAGLRATTALLNRPSDWEPWKAIAMAMTAGAALVCALSAAMLFLLWASGKV